MIDFGVGSGARIGHGSFQVLGVLSHTTTRCNNIHGRREPASAKCAEGSNQVFIALNWKALKAFLPDMSAAARMFVIAAYVARQQPLHELTQCGLSSPAESHEP